MTTSVLGRLANPRSQDADQLDAMPLEVMRERAAGFPMSDEFLSRRELFERLGEKGGRPRVVIVSCSDCPLDAGQFVGAEPGSLFSIRNAGNVVPPFGASRGESAAALELAMKRLPIEHIVVCGHSGCLTLDAFLFDPNPPAESWLKHFQATADALHRCRCNDEQDVRAWAAQHNVLVQLHQLSSHPAVSRKLADGQLTLHGWYFDTASGELFAAKSLGFTDDVCKLFEPI